MITSFIIHNKNLIFCQDPIKINGSNIDRLNGMLKTTTTKTDNLSNNTISFDAMLPVLALLKTPADQILFIHLLARAVNNQVQISHAKVSLWTGIKSKNTIRHVLKGLIKQGIITILSKGGNGLPSLLAITIPKDNYNNDDTNQDNTDNQFNPIKEPNIVLDADNQGRLQAIKRSLSPQLWETIQREAALSEEHEDQLILKMFFGPNRILNMPNDN